MSQNQPPCACHPPNPYRPHIQLSPHCPLHGSQSRPDKSVIKKAAVAFHNYIVTTNTTNANPPTSFDRDSELLLDSLNSRGPFDMPMPIVGFRAWTLGHQVRKVRLSPFSPYKNIPYQFELGPVGLGIGNGIWDLRGVNVAKHANTNAGHKVPQWGCVCGFHATKTLDLAMEQGGRVTGAVMLWGDEAGEEVIEHGDGYRAKYAQIIAVLEFAQGEHFMRETGIPVLKKEQLLAHCSEYGMMLPVT